MVTIYENDILYSTTNLSHVDIFQAARSVDWSRKIDGIAFWKEMTIIFQGKAFTLFFAIATIFINSFLLFIIRRLLHLDPVQSRSVGGDPAQGHRRDLSAHHPQDAHGLGGGAQDVTHGGREPGDGGHLLRT